ncbi:heavy metal-binding domain-containing protein [Mucilaginibacter xinganensis]|uniref:Heavy metal binding domain-containing protein n=1 Tax=Mucilaginibacter xinganensis TaxID=1234841 RepID=A0A223NT04_9SPHI|nr:heavy metal-binding domain-containing protein [Mucilaginibacter xinganensis]ASU32778.1 hypothetical protein MuYL_0878 [Mucilaginibacter xinganensis]
MKKIATLIALAGLMGAISSCDHPVKQAGMSKEVKKNKSKYFCPMNTDITSDKPGICSKCGMELVERDTTK